MFRLGPFYTPIHLNWVQFSTETSLVLYSTAVGLRDSYVTAAQI